MENTRVDSPEASPPQEHTGRAFEEYYREVRDSTNDYNETVQAVVAFAAFVCHDTRNMRPGSEFGIGRRMRTSPANVVSPDEDVTPDIVTQKSPNYGIAGEVKKQVSREPTRWHDPRDQLRKYDDNLVGWWTNPETVSHSDAVLLIHQTRGRAFARYLEQQRLLDPRLVGEHSAIVEFNRADEGQPYLFFRREWGQICDAELAAKLDDGMSIPMERVVLSFPLKFYDSPPPVESLMLTLWADSFAARANRAVSESLEDFIPITVTVDDITSELQRAYGSGAISSDERSTEFPQRSWIREALDAFVSSDFAVKEPGNDTYMIKYRSLSKDLLERFARLQYERRPKEKPRAIQLELLKNV
ncbi:MAG TPA: hypothetical protein VJU82_08960 [Acidobacteriaceae bacterium]|nr:hypothetical protein [Acidobacteriaceae bacterium]